MKNLNLYESFLNKPALKLVGISLAGAAVVSFTSCDKITDFPENTYIEQAKEEANDAYNKKIDTIKRGLTLNKEDMLVSYIEDGNYYSIEIYFYMYDDVNDTKTLKDVEHIILFKEEALSEGLDAELDSRLSKQNKIG